MGKHLNEILLKKAKYVLNSVIEIYRDTYKNDKKQQGHIWIILYHDKKRQVQIWFRLCHK